MLEDYFQIKKCVLCCGVVDLRKGIDGLAQIVGDHYKMNPFERGTLFIFCGRRTDRVKYGVSSFMGYLKSKSALMMFDDV